MSKPKKTFERILQGLEKYYGRPKAPAVTGPMEMILYENVAYLVDDEKRDAAFAALKKRVGLKPEEIMKAPEPALVEIARMGGMAPELRAQRIRQIAEMVHWVFKGNLRASLDKPLVAAKKDLKKFPCIGDPGAEKILLFNRSQPVLALDSNGLRVLQRLGYGEERKSYAASYRSAQEALAGELPQDCDTLIRAHQLLRRHGKELCRRSRPMCPECPVQRDCRYFLTSYPRPEA